MAVRKDTTQLIISIDAKESAAYQKSLQSAKGLIKDLRKMEVGQEGFNDKLRELKVISDQNKNLDFTKLTRKQLIDTRRELQRLQDILPQTTFRELEFEKQLKDVNHALADNRARTSASGKAMNRFGSILTALSPTFIAFWAVDRISTFFRTLFSGTAQLDQVQDRFSTVFGESSAIVDQWAKDTAIALGLTVEEYKKVAAASGDLLVPIGFQREEAAGLSKQVVELSAALAVWEGGQRSTEEITKILNKAMLGEREQLKELGVAIQEADVKQRLAAKGQANLTGEALKQAKALATLEIITENSSDAITAFGERSDSSAQISARVSARLRSWGEALQKRLLPYVNQFLIFLEKSVLFGEKLITTLAVIPKFVYDNRTAFFALGIAIASFNSNLIAASAASLTNVARTKLMIIWNQRSLLSWKALNAVFRANPIGFVIGLVATLVSGMILLYNRSEKVRAGIAGLGAVAKEVFTIVKEAVGAFIQGFNDLKEGNFKQAFASFGEAITKSNPIGIAFSEGGRLAGAFASGYIDKMSQEEEKAAQAAADALAARATESAAIATVSGGVNVGSFTDLGGSVNDKLTSGNPGKEAKQGKSQKINNPITALTEELQKRVEKNLQVIEIATERELQIIKKSQLEGAISEAEAEENSLLTRQAGLEKRLEFLREASLTETVTYRQLEIEKLEVQNELQENRINKTIERIEAETEVELDAIEKQYLQKLLSEQEYEQLLIENRIASFDEKLEFLKQQGLQETEIYRQIELEKLRTQKDLSDKEIENVKRTAEVKKMVQQEGLKVAADIFGETASLLSADEDARRKNAGAIKAFETSKVIVNSLVEISEIFKTFAALGPLGQLLAAGKAAAAGIRAASAVKSITGQKFSMGDIIKFSLGDMVKFSKGDLSAGKIFQGPSHAGGGVKFLMGDQIGEAEGGEAIINKKSTSLFKPVLSYINSYRGFGKKFAAGDVIGSSEPVGLSRSVFGSEEKELIDSFRAVAEQIQKIPEKLNGIRALVSLSEINNAQEVVNELERLSSY